MKAREPIVLIPRPILGCPITESDLGFLSKVPSQNGARFAVTRQGSLVQISSAHEMKVQGKELFGGISMFASLC